eukprot:TRINITY_DN3010_c0_g1_i2.p1 TRINITY_DN3010_c0_g1~~TRINITY_DN3010_c0_g1_i2.p1  ORF type:complete len:669 (-),score=185.93 TRINITY_DN3010_c0_g1_i2:1486-3492(-)
MFSKHTPAVMVEWKWLDAFRPVKMASNHSVKFERAAVLFNVGCAFSSCATSSDRSSDDGTKKAAQLFLKAAGVFQFMNDNPGDFAHSGTQDLTTSCFSWLKEFMYAQACAATFESAVLKKMSPATVAMLATGAAEQYERAKALASGNSPLGVWLGKSTYAWANHLQYQALCFRAAAQFWQAKVDIKDEKYGVEIGRLNYALELTKQSEKVEPNSNSLRDARKKLVDVITARLKAANKDNESIYYQTVTRQDDLPPIDAKILGKPTEYSIPPPSLPKIFEKLIPVEIQQAADGFRDEITKKFAVVQRNTSEASDLARASLASMNLPASLEAVETDEKLPQSLKSSIQSIQQLGGPGVLNVLRNEVKESAEGCYGLFNQITDALELELSKEKEMRKKYGIKWSRNTSEEVGAEYHRDLNTARKYLQQAQAADSKVDKTLDSHARLLAVLSQSVREIEATIPSSNTSLKSAESDAVRVELDRLSELLVARETLVKKFEEDLKECDIVDALMSAGKGSNIEKVLKQYVDKFDTAKSEVEVNIHEQEAIFSSIHVANDAFVASKTNNATLQKKQEIFHHLNQAIDTFNKLYKELNQGKKFYLDLIANCLQPLFINVNGFCVARETEAAILSEDLENHSRRASAESKVDIPPPSYDAFSPSAPDDFEYPNWGGR